MTTPATYHVQYTINDAMQVRPSYHECAQSMRRKKSKASRLPMCFSICAITCLARNVIMPWVKRRWGTSGSQNCVRRRT